jgi:thiol-disulfide isomerase/thioredoxin
MTTKLKNRMNKTELKSKPKFIIKLFSADWCPHCVNFKPIWNNIKIKYSDQVIFDEIDCTNTNPNLKYVVGLPTVVLYDKTGKYIKNYENNENNENFDLFIINLLK